MSDAEKARTEEASTSPTPRTDAFYAELYKNVPAGMVEAASGKERDFARQLERELAVVTQWLAEARASSAGAFMAKCHNCGRQFDSTSEGKTRRAELYCSLACANTAQPDMAASHIERLLREPRWGLGDVSHESLAAAISELFASSATALPLEWKSIDPRTFEDVNTCYVLPRSIRRVAVYGAKEAWALDLPPLPSASPKTGSAQK